MLVTVGMVLEAVREDRMPGGRNGSSIYYRVSKMGIVKYPGYIERRISQVSPNRALLKRI